MTVRAVEGKKYYTGGKAIEITEDKVINLRLRDENNLIIWDEGDNEIYVDLQLGDEITPTDTFPVGITTGRAIVDNGWDATGTLVCFKTTSGDNIKLFYTDSGSVFVDNGTGTFKQIYLKSEVDALLATKQNLLTAGDNITIDSNNVISSDKGIVVSNTQPSDATEGLLWYNTVTDQLKVYDGTNWNSIGGGGATYTAGSGINIDVNNEISNTLPFEPSNSGSTGQVLKKTNSGYSWQNESGGGGTYTGGDGISIDSNNVIDNTGVLSVNNSTGAVTVNEVPSGGNEGQVLQKTSSGYAWMNAITDANVKQWTINSNSVSGTTLKAIHDWVIADANNGAIIGDSYTNDVFLYHHTTTGSGQTNLIFYGVKRTSQKYTGGQNGDYTEAWQLKMAITYNGSSYSCVTSRNTDDATVTNYLSVEGSGYTTPFIPTADYQPTTKKYVDDRAVPTSGTTGYVLTKTSNGYGWSAPITSGVTSVNGDTGAVTLKTINSNAINGSGNIAINEVPSGGTTDQILTKTSNGYGWSNAPVTSVNNNTGAVTVNEVPSGGSNGQVLTQTSGGTPTWQTPASGGITNVTTGTTSTVTGIWAGTETEYTNLGTKSGTVLYFTF